MLKQDLDKILERAAEEKKSFEDFKMAFRRQGGTKRRSAHYEKNWFQIADLGKGMSEDFV